MLKNFTFKQVFLLDGCGAVLTALLLSLVLPRFENLIGMPRNILFILAGLAVCFAFYSFTCYVLIKKNWQLYLKGIAIANSLYCVLILGLMIFLHQLMTELGIAYFIGEIIVILILVRLELQFIKEKS